MGHMNKQQVEAEAKRLGINISGLSWPEMQKKVKEAKLKEESNDFNMVVGDEYVSNDSAVDIPKIITKPANIIRNKAYKATNPLDYFRGKTILLSPEIRARQNQVFKYDEIIGDDLDIEEAYYNGETLEARNTDKANGTYIIKGRTGKKVVAQSTLPKENAEIHWKLDSEMFPVCTYNGRSGYLLTHGRLPNVKDTLKQSGYWQDYRKQLSDEPNIWYAAGKQLCCDIDLVHSIMREIERKESRKRNGTE